MGAFASPRQRQLDRARATHWEIVPASPETLVTAPQPEGVSVYPDRATNPVAEALGRVAARSLRENWQNPHGTVLFVPPNPEGKTDYPARVIDTDRLRKQYASAFAESRPDVPLVYLQGLDTFFGDPGQSPEYDWQTALPPPGAPPRHERRTWIDRPHRTIEGQDTIYGAPGQSPEYDWQAERPRLAPPRPLNTTLTVAYLQPLIGQDRLYGDPGQSVNYEAMPGALAVPYPPRPHNRTETVRYLLTLIGQDSLYAGPGQSPEYDWQMERPRLAPPRPLNTTLAVAYLLPLVGQDTIYGDPGQAPEFDWQTERPRLPAPRPHNLTDHARYPLPLIGQEVIYGAPGQVPAYDWQLAPRGRPYPLAARTELEAHLTDTLFGALPPEIPDGKRSLPDNYRFAGRVLPVVTWSLLNSLFADQHVIAEGKQTAELWPRGRVRPLYVQDTPDLQGTLFTTPAPGDFPQGERAHAPAPLARRPALAVVATLGGLGTAILTQTLPEGLAASLATGTALPRVTGRAPEGHLQRAQLLLLGQDVIYGAPGQAPLYTWPVPPPKGRAADLRAELEAHLTDTLAGQDRLYGEPGQAPLFATAPLPLTRARRYLHDPLNLILTAVAPPPDSLLPEGARQDALPPRGAPRLLLALRTIDALGNRMPIPQLELLVLAEVPDNFGVITRAVYRAIRGGKP